MLTADACSMRQPRYLDNWACRASNAITSTVSTKLGSRRRHSVLPTLNEELQSRTEGLRLRRWPIDDIGIDPDRRVTYQMSACSVYVDVRSRRRVCPLSRRATII